MISRLLKVSLPVAHRGNRPECIQAICRHGSNCDCGWCSRATSRWRRSRSDLRLLPRCAKRRPTAGRRNAGAEHLDVQEGRVAAQPCSRAPLLVSARRMMSLAQSASYRNCERSIVRPNSRRSRIMARFGSHMNVDGDGQAQRTDLPAATCLLRPAGLHRRQQTFVVFQLQVAGPRSARKISTRRFMARPSRLALVATGSRSPRPSIITRLGLTPRAAR